MLAVQDIHSEDIYKLPIPSTLRIGSFIPAGNEPGDWLAGIWLCCSPPAQTTKGYGHFHVKYRL